MFSSDLLIGIAAIVAGVLGFLGYGVTQKRKGRLEERTEAKEADHERAKDIRNRVEWDLDKRLREADDDSGFRD